MNKQFRKSLFWIFGSLACTACLSFVGYSAYSRWFTNRLKSDKYSVRAIIQTGSQKEALRTTYLAELMGLSVDQPKNIYSICLKEAEEALLKSPLIAKAKVKRRPPQTLYVDYEVRTPIAWIADYKNVAVDLNGRLFPVAPFLPPKRLPEIYLGLATAPKTPEFTQNLDEIWSAPLTCPQLKLAFDLLKAFEGAAWTQGLRVTRVDVSNAFAPTLGRREVVLFTDEEVLIGDRTFIFPKILRMNPKNHAQQLNNFFALRRSMMDDYKKQLASFPKSMKFSPRIIDLRAHQIAFIEK
jgi:hypothetical protein